MGARQSFDRTARSFPQGDRTCRSVRLVAVTAAAVMLAALVVGLPAEAEEPPGPGPVPVSLTTVQVQGRDGTVQAEREFSLVGVRWTGPAPDHVRLRVQRDGVWQQWLEAHAPDGGPATASEPIYTGPSTQLQVEAIRGAAPASGVSVVLIDPGHSPADAHPVTQRTGDVPIIPRAAWGADEAMRCGAPDYADKITAFTLHHTAGANDYGPGDSAGIVRGIYAYHAQALGWCDIGYHALVDRFGQLFEGRAGGLDQAVIGAHAGGFNTRTTSLAMIGSYTNAPLADVEKESIGQYVSGLARRWGLDPHGGTTLTSAGGGTSRFPAGQEIGLPVLMGHRDTGNTECPGEDGYAFLPELRDRVAFNLAPPPPPPPPAVLAETPPPPPPI